MSESPAPTATTVSTPQRGSLLAGACLLYLLLPNLFFLEGWVEPWLAWPLIVLLSFGCFLLWRRLGDAAPAAVRGGRIHLAFCLLAGAAAVYLIGFNGHFPQSPDFTVRNAAFATLAREEWPIFGSGGEYFVYYHAFWLVPAWVADCCRGLLPLWVPRALWVYAGMALGILCLYRRVGRRTLSLLAVAFFLGSLQEILVRADVYTAYLPCLSWLNAYRDGLEAPVIYIELWHQLCATYNQAVPVLLFLCMLHARMLPAFAVLPLSALLVACSPLASLALLCYLVFWLGPRAVALCRPVLCTLLLYPCLLLLGLLGLYFLSGAGSHTGMGWQSPCYAGDAPRFLLAYVLATVSILAQWYAFGWRFRRTAAFRASLLLFFLLPLIWVGCDVNELLFKGALLPYFFMALFLHSTWRYASLKKRCLLAVLFLCCAYIPFLDIQHRLREFGISPEQVELNSYDGWNGHMNHPDDSFFYDKLWGAEPPPFFKKNAFFEKKRKKACNGAAGVL